MLNKLVVLALFAALIGCISSVEARSVVAKAVTLKRCQSIGDPHYTTFNNVRYDFMGIGDFVLAQTRDKEFIVHTRHGKWAAASVNINVGVQLGLDEDGTFEYDINKDAFYIGGIEASFPVGKKANVGSGTVQRLDANTVIITASNGARMTAHWYRNAGWVAQLGSIGYISLTIDAPSNLEFDKGMCLDATHTKLTADGILHDHKTRKLVRVLKPVTPTPGQEKIAAKLCKKAGLLKKKNPNAFKACVADEIISGKKIGAILAKQTAKIKKTEENQNKKYVKKIGSKFIKKAKHSVDKASENLSRWETIVQNLKKMADEKKAKCAKKATDKVHDAEDKLKTYKKKLQDEKAKLENVKKTVKDARERITKKKQEEANRRAVLKAQKLAKIAGRKAKRAAEKAARAKARAERRATKKNLRLARIAKKKAEKEARKAKKIAEQQKKKAARAVKAAAKKALKEKKRAEALKRRAERQASKKARQAARKIAREAAHKARQAAREARRLAFRQRDIAKLTQLKKEQEKRRAERAARKAKRAAEKAKKQAQRAARKAKFEETRKSRKAAREAKKKAKEAARKAKQAARKLEKAKRREAQRKARIEKCIRIA